MWFSLCVNNYFCFSKFHTEELTQVQFWSGWTGLTGCWHAFPGNWVCNIQCLLAKHSSTLPLIMILNEVSEILPQGSFWKNGQSTSNGKHMIYWRRMININRNILDTIQSLLYMGRHRMCATESNDATLFDEAGMCCSLYNPGEGSVVRHVWGVNGL